MTTVWCMKTTEFSKLNFILTWITFFYSCLFAVEVRHYVMTVGMNRPNGYFIRYFFCFFAIILQIGFTIRLFYWTLFQTFFVNCISSKTFFYWTTDVLCLCITLLFYLMLIVELDWSAQVGPLNLAIPDIDRGTIFLLIHQITYGLNYCQLLKKHVTVFQIFDCFGSNFSHFIDLYILKILITKIRTYT